MSEVRTEYLDTIKLSDSTMIERYRHYFSGKMDIIEVRIGK